MQDYRSIATLWAREAALVCGAVMVMALASPVGADPVAPPPAHETYDVVEATGIHIPLHTTLNVHKTMTMKKGQSLVLKASSGTLYELDGPFKGKPIDHYTAVDGDNAMGFDAKSFGMKHCSGGGSSGSHPQSGPNPDETGGAENQASHCQ